MTREELMRRVSTTVLKRIGHEPCEWEASSNPLFNSIFHSECTKNGCDTIFGIKQFHEFYSMFAMKEPDYTNVGIIEITFSDDKLLDDMEERMNDTLSKNRAEFLKIPREVYCSTMQNFI